MKKKVICIVSVLVIIIAGMFIFKEKTLPGKPCVSADIRSEKTIISWSVAEDADRYEIYRKTGRNGTFICIGETGKTEFTDIYRNTVKDKEEKKHLRLDRYIDPSENPFSYTVKGVKGHGLFKRHTDYDKEGVFHMETPVIVSVKENNKDAEITWSEVCHAEEYEIFTGRKEDGKVKWKKAGTFKSGSDFLHSEKIRKAEEHNCYTVKAVFKRNGKQIRSGYDKGFCTENRNYENTRMLFIGDSITFGSPYKEQNDRHIFSYPRRIKELTGVNIYNPSIPGASYSEKEKGKRDRLVTQVAESIHRNEIPEATDKRIKADGEPGSFEDFDIIVFAAGANDYFDNIPLGEEYSRNKEELNGALNCIGEWINQGNKIRIAKGKNQIKLVFAELFYNEKNGDFSSLTFRIPEKNTLGLQVSDYQNTINGFEERMKEKGFTVKHFETENFVTPENFPYATSDGLHMTRYTYSQIGNSFSTFLVREVL